MKIARLLLTPELVRDLLHLPIATGIIGAGWSEGSVELVVTHPDLRDIRLVSTERPPLIRPTFHRQQDTVVLVDWGQP